MPDLAKVLEWAGILGKIGAAAAPLVMQLAKLFGLLGEAKARNLTIEEVEEEIKKILSDSKSMDAIENELAGLDG